MGSRLLIKLNHLMIHLMIRNCLKKLQLLLNSFKEKEGKNNKKNKRKNK